MTPGKQKITEWYHMQAYHGLPCELEKFTIRDEIADKDDFGSSEDTDPSDEPYTCGCHEFTRIHKPSPDVLEKYKITRDQFDEIADALVDVLYVGYCGWCV